MQASKNLLRRSYSVVLLVLGFFVVLFGVLLPSFFTSRDSSDLLGIMGLDADIAYADAPSACDISYDYSGVYDATTGCGDGCGDCCGCAGE